MDGIAGQKTKNGVREFQTAFGLKPTGEVDEAVYARMKEVGFAD